MPQSLRYERNWARTYRFRPDWAACWVVDFPMLESSDEVEEKHSQLCIIHSLIRLETLTRCFKIQVGALAGVRYGHQRL